MGFYCNFMFLYKLPTDIKAFSHAPLKRYTCEYIFFHSTLKEIMSKGDQLSHICLRVLTCSCVHPLPRITKYLLEKADGPVPNISFPWTLVMQYILECRVYVKWCGETLAVASNVNHGIRVSTLEPWWEHKSEHGQTLLLLALLCVTNICKAARETYILIL
jgi:hypothetical protein